MNIRGDCLSCKGRFPKQFCGRDFCPIIAKSKAMFKVKDGLPSENFSGSSPAPFVGRFGYPHVNVGLLAPPVVDDSVWKYDAPMYWAKEDFDIPKVVDYRSALINSRFNVNIKDKSRLLEIGQEVGMASKPVELEINLEKKPSFGLNTSNHMAPTGPNAKLKKVRVSSNVKVDRKVDKVVSDTDLKANDAMIYLYENKYDENFLSKILSVGNLGLGKDRKLVPTRWSITASDDNVGKHLIENVKQYSETGYLAYFGGYLGNYYLILFFPDVWSYELFESYAPGASWNIGKELRYMTDNEGYDGRKEYASNTVGGYYAARLGILEKLRGMKRQSSVLCLRFITGEYAVPLGVWVVREATRKALENKPIEFSSKELMLEYARKIIKKKFGYSLENILKSSVLLRNMKNQMKLRQFI